MANNNVKTFLDVSTGNITEDDMSAITLQGLHTMQSEYGALVHVPHHDEPWQMKLDEWNEHKMSEAFVKVMSLARERGCDYVLLDRDADYLDGFEVFEW